MCNLKNGVALIGVTLAAVVTTIVASGLCGVARAADSLPVAAPGPAPSPVAPWSWTGLYVGVHAGTGWGTKDWTALNQSFGFPPFPPTAVGTAPLSGVLGGVQIGINYQIGRAVAGLEGSFAMSNLNGNISGLGSKPEELGTVTARLGGTLDNLLVYAKGGTAWVRDHFTDSYTAFSGVTPVGVSLANTQSRWGWTAGVGVEYAFGANWSAKIEYDYLDFGTFDVNFGADPISLASGFGSHNSFTVQQRVQLVKAGVNYRFDWGGR